MCLSKTHKWPKFAVFPKRVVKLLTYVGEDYFTPYRGHYVIFNKPIKATGSLVNGIRHDHIFGEGIHAYRDAPYELFWYASTSIYPFEAAIPPFTFYWEGRNRDIATRRLIVFKKNLITLHIRKLNRYQSVLWYINRRWGNILRKLRVRIYDQG